MMNVRQDFEDALMTDRVATRFAMPAAQGKSPFADAKMQRAMGRAPLESEKLLKRLHRIKDRDRGGGADKADKLREEGRKVHQSLVEKADEVAKSIRGFLEAKGDVEAESDARAWGIETAVDYMAKLERQIKESKQAGKGSYLSQIVEDAETLHAAILNAAATLSVLMKD